MKLHFITGNDDKFSEAYSLMPNLERLTLDLDEVQDIDPHRILQHKMNQAFAHHPGPFIVEDTSLYLECLHGLPGPFIKWFEQTIGLAGLATLAAKMGDPRALAVVLIGYAENINNVQFFEGSCNGTITLPRGSNGFGWDQIFIPDGQVHTFAEMSPEQKNSMSMRKLAMDELITYLKHA